MNITTSRTALIAAVIAASATLSLAGCGSSNPVAAVSGPTGGTSSASPASSAPAVPKTAKLGQTVTFASGVKLTVSAGAPFQPSQFAAGTDGAGTPLAFTVTVENGSTDVFDPTLISWSCSSAGQPSDEIIDSGAGIDGIVTSKVLPGKSLSWKIAAKFADPNDVQLDMTALNSSSTSLGDLTYNITFVS